MPLFYQREDSRVNVSGFLHYLCVTMLRPGQYHLLEVLRNTSVGLYLADEEGEEVLLPNKYVPEGAEPGDELQVFIYRDSEDRKIATTLKPKLLLHEFGMLRVKEVSRVGAFLDWGLEKDLIVPFHEQQSPMEAGREYLVFLELDEETDRLFASSKLDNFLENEILRVEKGEEVDLLVFHESEMGYSVIVNEVHKGLVYRNETFRELKYGEQLKGWVRRIREENKLDITIHPIGYGNFIEPNSRLLLEKLKDSGGFLALNDKSSPELIYETLNISKKNFKKAVGALYREKHIAIEEEGIRLLDPEK